MRLHLVPEERGFYELFRRDLAACQAGVTALLTMLRSPDDAKEQARLIHEIEHEGDRATGAIFVLLNRTFITPLEREDIIALAGIVDDVLDAVDEIATMLALYGIKQSSVYLLEAGTLLLRATDTLAAAVGRLESPRDIAPLVEEVHRLEAEADGLYYNAIAELFLPDTYSPIEVFKWHRLYDLMENAIDTCEDAANVLRNIVLKNA